MTACYRSAFWTALLLVSLPVSAQLQWTCVDSAYQPLPRGVHLYRSADSLDGSPSLAYYLEVPLRTRRLRFTVDTTISRRLTPTAFFERNGRPLAVVNCTFFSLSDNRNLSALVRDGQVLGRNQARVRMTIGDTARAVPVYRGAFGLKKGGRADIAWVVPDSLQPFLYASQQPLAPDTVEQTREGAIPARAVSRFRRWKVRTAVGGGPVLVQDQRILITNEAERMFAGKALMDKHPRTAIGYTADGRLLILMVQGRQPGTAEGASLPALARLLVDLGCTEALNLDGGGSSCLLVNGKETIRPSDKEGQRPVPAVLIIR